MSCLFRRIIIYLFIEIELFCFLAIFRAHQTLARNICCAPLCAVNACVCVFVFWVCVRERHTVCAARVNIEFYKCQPICFHCCYKVDVEALKHAPNWGLRHRRDSISGFSTHSQPTEYPFGTHSPAPTYHSGKPLTTK